MNRIYQTIVSALNTALSDIIRKAADFLPNLVSALLILLIGWIAAKVAEKVLTRLLEALGMNQAAERRGVIGTLAELGIKRPPAQLVSRVLYWVILILFLVPTLETLRLLYVSQLVGEFVAYLPNLIGAALIFLIGLAVARLLAGSAAAAAKNAGLEYASALGMFTRYFLALIVVILSLAQLGVRTDILTNVFTVLIISLGLAMALALGLGSRAVVSNILAGAFIREHFPAGREIRVQGVSGRVVSIGPVGTTVESEGREITFPNTMLMENVIE
ncbi:MAG: mechanosensitive ion channel family protein [Blastocatellia bacterium]